MIKHIQPTALLLMIVLLGLFSRLVWLDHNPQVLNRDEAALAYSAVLLRETGVDEWRQSWPLALQSFGDYKLIGYPAILSILFGFTGYTDFAVRLPAAAAGTILIWLSYVLSRRMGSNQAVALFVALCTAGMGPAFFFSRMAFEAMVALACWAGILVLSTSSDKRFLLRMVLILLLAAASLLTYNTPLAYTIILGLSWPVFFGLNKNKSIVFSLVALVLAASVFWSLKPLITQKSAITIFSDEAIREGFYAQYPSSGPLLSRVQHSAAVYFGTRIINRYASHFSPSFLVTRGGTHPWHSLPGTGHFSWLIYGLFLIGLMHTLISSAKLFLRLIKSGPDITNEQRSSLFLVAWVLFSLLPSAITVDAPHATRSLLFLFLVPVVAGTGLQFLLWRVGAGQRKLLVTFVLWLVLGIIQYQYQYHFEFPARQLDNFQTGFKTAIQNAYASHPDQPIAVVDTSGYLYVLAAWYAPIRADIFLDTIVHQQPDSIGFRYGERVGPFHFVAQDSDVSAQEKVLVQPIVRGSGQWLIKDL